MGLDIEQSECGVVFGVKVVPGSSRSGIVGLLGGALKVHVAKPPEKGRANKELIQLLAERLTVGKNCVSVISGGQSRHKKVRITGITGRELIRGLGELIV